ncbi:MAG: YIP1 family protein [Thalassovita sp.]
MAFLSDIAATYRSPRRVLGRLLTMGIREDRALVVVMAGCVVVFIAQWPRLARQAHLSGEELNILLGSTLLAWVFIMPLFLYLMAFVTRLGARAIGGKGTAFGARMALFWALLAASPVMLVHGLLAGFVGRGIVLDIVGLLWLGFFAWFWLSGLIESEWGKTRDTA